MTTITMKEVAAFLLGEAPLDGAWFGDTRPSEHGQFWWRKHLRAALAAPATAPSWQDAPTVPGLWVRNSCDCIGAYLIHESAIPILQGSRSRWFGPLPEDKQ